MHRHKKYDSGYQGLDREGNGELLLSGYRVSMWGDGKVLEMDNDEMKTYIHTQTCTQMLKSIIHKDPNWKQLNVLSTG